MTRCELAARLLAGHAAGELEPMEKAIVEDHLAECAACRAELERERHLRELMHGLPGHACPDELTAAITAAVDAEAAVTRRRPPAPPSRRHAWTGRVAAAAVLAAAVLLVVLLPRPEAPTDMATAPATQTPTGSWTQDELDRAREDVQWALAFTATVIERAEKQTMIDVMRRLQEETFSGLRDRTPPTSNGGRG
jgi:predicted anti-sigma-YlaC factor YlaD